MGRDLEGISLVVDQRTLRYYSGNLLAIKDVR